MPVRRNDQWNEHWLKMPSEGLLFYFLFYLCQIHKCIIYGGKWENGDRFKYMFDYLLYFFFVSTKVIK